MRSHWRQKLSNEQIATIFHLYRQGYTKAIIATTVKQSCGVALSTTYYHLDKLEITERLAKRELIHALIKQGYTTADIAKQWNVPLLQINQIYAGKRVN